MTIAASTQCARNAAAFRRAGSVDLRSARERAHARSLRRGDARRSGPREARPRSAQGTGTRVGRKAHARARRAWRRQESNPLKISTIECLTDRCETVADLRSSLLSLARGSRSQPTRSPGPARDRERRLRHPRAAELAELAAPRVVELRDVRTRRADAELVRCPPLLKALELDADRERRLLHVGEARFPEELAEMPLACAGKMRLVLRRRVELLERCPERRQGRRSCVVTPHACRDDAAGQRHTRHLR